MKHTLKGIQATRRVWLDGVELAPYTSQLVINHSPDGFNWGYEGSGPAQLALAIMLKLTGNTGSYQDFKRRVIATIPYNDFEIEFDLIEGQEMPKIKQLFKVSRQKIETQHCYIRAYSLEQATEYAEEVLDLSWSDPDFIEFDYYQCDLVDTLNENFEETTIEDVDKIGPLND